MARAASGNHLIVVDVANVGFAYGEMVLGRRRYFDWNGVRCVQQYYGSRNIQTACVALASIVRYDAIPDDMLSSIAVAPVDDRHPDIDDIFCLQFAKDNGGFVLSNDNFRNLPEKLAQHPQLADLGPWCHEWLSKVRISYMFVRVDLNGVKFCPSSQPFEVPYGHGSGAAASAATGSASRTVSTASAIFDSPVAKADSSVITDLTTSTFRYFGVILQQFNGEPYGPEYLKVEQGQKVSVIDVESDWALVQCDAAAILPGWVPLDYVQKMNLIDV